mgnify:CR=1 FL=1
MSGLQTSEKLAIVIPIYNEKENVKELIPKLKETASKLPCKTQIFLIDDRSRDGTYKLLKSLITNDPLFKLYQRSGRRNRGLTVIYGMKIALLSDPDYILEMDADLSHDPRFIEDFYKKISRSAKIHVVLGSRFLETSDFQNRPWFRNLITFGSIKFIQFYFKMPFSDPNLLFRCYRASILKKLLPLLLTSDPRELTIKAYYFGFTIEEIPIIYRERTKGRSKFGFFALTKALRAMVFVRRNLENLAKKA